MKKGRVVGEENRDSHQRGQIIVGKVKEKDRIGLGREGETLVGWVEETDREIVSNLSAQFPQRLSLTL